MSKDVNNIGNRTSLQKALKDVDKEYISNLWKFSMQVRKLDTGRIQSAEEMEDRIQKLFDLCYQTGNMPTYESIAVACGIPSSTFYDMRQRKLRWIQAILGNNQKSKGASSHDRVSNGKGWQDSVGTLDIQSEKLPKHERLRTSGGSFESVRGCSESVRGYSGDFAGSSNN